MGVSAVVERHEGRRAEQTRSATRYTRVFLVTLTSATDGPIAAIRASALPGIGTALGVSGVLLTVRRKYILRAQDRLNFEVAVEYSNETSGASGEENPDPLSRPRIVSLGFRHYREQLIKDVNGLPIQSSSGEAFDPLPEVDRSRPVITIERNVAGIREKIGDFQDSINSSDTVVGGLNVKKWQGRIIELGATSAEENGVSYFRERVAVEVRKDLHVWEHVDEGLYTKDGAGALEPLFDNFSDALRVPFKLDGEGNQLADGADPVFFVWDVYEEQDWGPLALA